MISAHEPTEIPEGVFITLEGIDGSGKSLAAKKLANALLKKGHRVLLTREPGGSDFGLRLRRLLLHGEHRLDPLAEVLLFSADRAQHVSEIIRPALQSGMIVICDRFIDSTIAYQCGGRRLDQNTVDTLNRIACGGLLPAITFLFSVSLDTSLARRKQIRDRIESEEEGFYERIIVMYNQISQESDRILIIDGQKKPAEVLRDMLSALNMRFGGRFGG